MLLVTHFAVSRRAIFSLLIALSWAVLTANAQFKEVGPAPLSKTVARERIRNLLKSVDAVNRTQTIAKISVLLPWYREIFDEESIAAWKGSTRANLPELLESLADSRIAIAIVDFSWSQQRSAAFLPDYAPLLGHLMARYPESAKPSAASALAGKTPSLILVSRKSMS